MSLTERTTDIDRFFAAVVVSLHEALERSGTTLFPTSPDPSLESYYVPRARSRMRPEDFEAGSCQNAQTLASALREMWKEETRLDLVSTIESHVELATALREQALDQAEEPSPFLYALF